MKTVTSVSGGQSSAYIAANYPSDFLVFALVCIEDPACAPTDKKLVQKVSDRIGREFIATAEDDVILHTMFDLEQYLGQKIDWVAGMTFDALIDQTNGYLPNKTQRFCTQLMKIDPMFSWWQKTIGEPIAMQMGLRSGEDVRAARIIDKCDDDGLLSYRHIVGKLDDGRNRWANTPWQKPVFPMIEDGIRRHQVTSYWTGRPVRFAPRNNCVGCMHRNPLLLRKMFDAHPAKMEWFARQEERGQWRSDVTYDQIKKHNVQHDLDFDDFSECDSGHCGL